jgi:hypothetical protein
LYSESPFEIPLYIRKKKVPKTSYQGDQTGRIFAHGDIVFLKAVFNYFVIPF